MKPASPSKSTVDQIRARFDNDVERFSNLETGQSATIDAPLVLDLIAAAAAAVNPSATHLLDVGCGAGNYSLKLLSKLPKLDVTLIDLSQPMLDRAVQRIRESHSAGAITPLRGDIRSIDLGAEQFDIILASAVLHHLRTDREWEAVFAQFYRALRPSGSIWISDLVAHDVSQIQTTLWQRYGDYLVKLKDATYRDHVLAYVEREDTPRSATYQLGLLQKVGFRVVDILHKNGPFAALAAVK